MLAATSLVAALLVVSCEAEKAPDVSLAESGLSARLRAAVDPDGIFEHAERFQAIADAHGGNRAAGTPGYDASADYVANKLRRAGYEVAVQQFEFPASAATVDAELRETGVADGREYELRSEFAPMERTAGGDVQAPLRSVDAGPTSGCEMEDFDGFPEGNVALLRRGTCTFGAKARNAEAAGASAAVVSNAGEPAGEVLLGALDGTAVGIPVVGTSAAVGEGLLARDGPAEEVRIFVGDGDSNRTTNVVAQTRGGDEEETVMLGAHLDSVVQGPGINDNGSGSATVLEIALRLAEIDAGPRNRVRFAFWGAEELGLVGSRHYVEELEDDELEDISAYLNFDMVGSPNSVTSVYEGPEEVEEIFGSYFEARNIEVETNSALDGRSDHGPFQEEGVPTGGLFTGAEGTKTDAQQEAFGGEAGAPLDACYHRACDDIDNIDEKPLGELSDAAAHAAAVLAEREAS